MNKYVIMYWIVPLRFDACESLGNSGMDIWSKQNIYLQNFAGVQRTYSFIDDLVREVLVFWTPVPLKSQVSFIQEQWQETKQNWHICVWKDIFIPLNISASIQTYLFTTGNWQATSYQWRCSHLGNVFRNVFTFPRTMKYVMSKVR